MSSSDIDISLALLRGCVAEAVTSAVGGLRKVGPQSLTLSGFWRDSQRAQRAGVEILGKGRSEVPIEGRCK
ncbi:hypothetical protein E4U41_004080, partial [Claviceps citrina]